MQHCDYLALFLSSNVNDAQSIVHVSRVDVTYFIMEIEQKLGNETRT